MSLGFEYTGMTGAGGGLRLICVLLMYSSQCVNTTSIRLIKKILIVAYFISSDNILTRDRSQTKLTHPAVCLEKHLETHGATAK